jgi:malonyl-CoA O-methyltransferase
MSKARKTRIAGRFAAAAGDYDVHSPLQLKVALRLAARVGELALPAAPRVLELGCGTGHLTRALLPAIGGDWIVSDIAPAMVAACRQSVGGGARYLIMDGERPALAPGRFDLIVASLAAQWFADLPAALASLAPLLAPGGRIALATLGRGTFAEWRAAHAALGLVAATPRYPDAAELARAFPAGVDVAVDEESFVEPHAAPLDFLRGLRRIGADTPAPGTRPLSAAQLRQVLRELAGHAGMSYELLYAIARPSSSTSQPRTTR